MLLGLSAPIDTLARGFADAAGSRTCRGFAVGRTIFHEPARAWLAGAIDDAGLVAGVRTNFEALIDAWTEARSRKRAVPRSTMSTIRLTMAQALVRYLAAQGTVGDGREVPLFGGVWAIFGHGNVAGIGEALYRHRAALPTYRAHNEQAMAHAAIAFAKAHFRRRMMACTTSIGPGATNLITAAATAHVNRLPVLFLPGDVFVSRAPDPVLQQVEDFHDGGISANDCFKPVSRYFDRIVAPSQLLTALPRAIVRADRSRAVRPGDARAAAGRAGRRRTTIPRRSSRRRCMRIRAPLPEAAELEVAAGLLRAAKQPVIVAGGGVLYSDGGAEALARFAEAHRVPVAETQAGKSALPWDHPLQAGPIGVTGAHGRERARAGRRPRPRGRHAAVGLHDGLAFAVSRRRRSSRSTSTRSTR